MVGELQSIGEAALQIGGAALASATAAVVGFGAASLDAFGDFQTGVNEIFSILPGITDDAMRQMESSIQAFMERTGRSTQEATGAIYEALSAGVPQDNIWEFMRVANMAAVGGVTDLQTAVDGLTSVVNAYGAEAYSAGEASDILFEAVRLGKLNMEDLSNFMYQVVPVAAAMGVELEDVAAALAVMTSQGVPAQVATTQLRNAFVELNDPASEAGSLFQELTGKVFQDFIAEGHTVAEALALMEEEANRLGVPISQLFSSIEAGQAALALTGTNMEFFTEATETMGNAAGATERAFNQMNQGIGMALNRLGGRWESLLISMGRLIEPFVTPLVEAFSTIIAYLAATLDSTDPLNDWLADLPQWLRPAVFFLGEMAVWILKAAEAFGSFVAAINAGVPFLTAFQTFLYNVAGFDVAYYFGQFAEAAGEFFTQVMTVLQPVIDWVMANVELQDVLIALGIAIASVVIPAVVAFFAAFAPLVLLIAAIAALRVAWENDFLGMRTAITTAWTEIQPIIESITGFLTGLWDAIQAGGFEGAATYVQENLITPLIDALTQGFANIDWAAMATSIITFLGNALLTLVDWAVWAYDNLLVPLFNAAKTGIEQIDWFQVGNSIMLFIGDALKAAFDFVAWLINSIFNPITENTDEATGQIDWSGVGDAIMSAIANGIVAFLDFALWVTNTILTPLVQGALTAIDAIDWSSFGNSVMNAISAAWPNVSEWVQTNIIGPIQSALSGFNPFNSINTTNPAGIQAGSLALGQNASAGAQIVPRQFGGSVTSGAAYWVGESGRELFVPNSDGQVMNNRDSELASGGGGKGIQIVFNFHRGISDDEARESAYKLTRELKAQGIQIEG